MHVIWFALWALGGTLVLCLCALILVGTYTGIRRHLRGER